VNIGQFLVKAARTSPNRPAIAIGTRVVCDYRGLAARAHAIASSLQGKLALRPGERVGLAMVNCPEYLEIQYAIWLAGLIAVPINAGLHQREFHYILGHSGARVCFTTPNLFDTVKALEGDPPTLERVIGIHEPGYAALGAGGGSFSPVEVAPSDAAWLFYTSGTTGRPKGAMLSHRVLLTMTLSYYADIEAVHPGEAVIHAAPLSHGSGLYGLPFVAKAGVSVIPESGRFDPEEMLTLIAAWPDTSFFAVPTMVARLVNSEAAGGADTRNLRTIVYGGAPMYVADLERSLGLLGPKLVQIYGQGETPMTATALSKRHHADTAAPRYLEHLRSAGVTRTDCEVRVVDAEDRALGTEAIGEIVVRGDVVMSGYWQDPEASARALRGGWLHTGDLGSFDDEGFLTIRDRAKDMVISGGSNIYPREIEEVLLRHPGVLECSVLGRPHRDWGEEVVAFVVPRTPGAVVEAELDRLCLDNVARFKRPRSYFFVNRLPKSNYGKILKTELREQLRAMAERSA